MFFPVDLWFWREEVFCSAHFKTVYDCGNSCSLESIVNVACIASEEYVTNSFQILFFN